MTIILWVEFFLVPTFQGKISSWYLICVYQVKWSISALSDPKYTIIGTWFITETVTSLPAIVTSQVTIIFTKQTGMDNPSPSSIWGRPGTDWRWEIDIVDPSSSDPGLIWCHDVPISFLSQPTSPQHPTTEPTVLRDDKQLPVKMSTFCLATSDLSKYQRCWTEHS